MELVNEVAKSQWVRIWNVLGMVPIQWHIAKSNPQLLKWERVFLREGGLVTLLFNGRNYLQDRGTEIKPFPKVPGRISSVYRVSRSTKKRINLLRLFVDVLFYGPAMIAIANRHKLPAWQEAFLYTTGVMTILVNGGHFLLNLKEDPLA